MKSLMKRKDWTGVRQGRITVLGYAGDGIDWALSHQETELDEYPNEEKK